MKIYQCRKEVIAKPITIGEFTCSFYDDNEEGYAIIEEDGSETWVKKECFERDHVLVDTWKDRLIVERDELKVKVDKLTDFISSKTFNHVSQKEKDLLRDQLLHMQVYLKILNRRIDG